MKGLVVFSCLIACLPVQTRAQTPVHTYSIVARDPATGQLGVAVQSHWFSVGPIVAWAEAGVGAVATQSLVEVSYGPLGLQLMKAGKDAGTSLAALILADEHPEIRQVAMVDSQGGVAVHTGERCIAEAGHMKGPGYSVQANLMLKDTVPEAMAAAFEASEGDLAERMLATLEAAQAEGGDIRGKQSAALVVVAGKSSGLPWRDRLVDLRIDDHPTPIREMRRLLRLHRAYEHMNAGDLAMEQNDFAAASREYGAAQKLNPGSAEMLFWHAVTLVGAGKIDEARPLLAKAFGLEPKWRQVIPRLVPSGLFPDDADLVEDLSNLESKP